jgi:hypothetical protein
VSPTREHLHRLYTVEFQASDDSGQVWQAMHPAETVTAFNDETVGQVARFAAGNQDIAEGTNWRVAVWDGRDADTGTDPVYVLYAADVR